MSCNGRIACLNAKTWYLSDNGKLWHTDNIQDVNMKPVQVAFPPGVSSFRAFSIDLRGGNDLIAVGNNDNLYWYAFSNNRYWFTDPNAWRQIPKGNNNDIVNVGLSVAANAVLHLYLVLGNGWITYTNGGIGELGKYWAGITTPSAKSISGIGNGSNAYLYMLGKDNNIYRAPNFAFSRTSQNKPTWSVIGSNVFSMDVTAPGDNNMIAVATDTNLIYKPSAWGNSQWSTIGCCARFAAINGIQVVIIGTDGNIWWALTPGGFPGNKLAFKISKMTSNGDGGPTADPVILQQAIVASPQASPAQKAIASVRTAPGHQQPTQEQINLKKICSLTMDDAAHLFFTNASGQIAFVNDARTNAGYNIIPGGLSMLSISYNGWWFGGANGDGDIWRTQEIVKNNLKPTWNKIGNSSVSISLHLDGSWMSVANDGTLWFVEQNQKGKKVSTPGDLPLMKIYSRHTIGRNGIIVIIARNGNAYWADAYNNANPVWNFIGDNILDIAVHDDGRRAWVINTANDIGHIPNIRAVEWKPIDGKGTQIEYNGNNVLGIVGTDGFIYLANVAGNGMIDRWYQKPNYGKLTEVYRAPAYTNLSSPESNPGVYTSSLSSPNIPKSVITNLAAANVLDFYPFKFLSLFELVKMDKMTFGTCQVINNASFNIYQATFSPSDVFLPVGDIMVNGDKNLNSIYVLLIANNPDYCTIISDSSWKYVINTSGSTPPNNNWSTVALKTKDRIYNNEYTSMGDCFLVGTDLGKITRQTGNGNRPIAAVRSDFVVKKGGINYNIPDVMIYNTDRVTISATSPFYTFNSAGAEGGSRSREEYYSAGNRFGKDLDGASFYWPTYAFFDIAPQYILAAACGNSVSFSALNLPSTYGKELKGNCSSYMNKYISSNKYANVYNNKTVPVIKDWCASKDANCDVNLFAFCASDKNKNTRAGNSARVPLTISESALLDTYPNSKNDICNCFMPEDYYMAKAYNSMFQAYGDKEGGNVFNQMKTSGAFNYPECSNQHCSNNQAIHTYSYKTSASQKCPNVQVCSNTLNLDLNGAQFQDAPVNISQNNNCKQINNEPGLKTPATQSAADKAAADKAAADKAAADKAAADKAAKERQEADKAAAAEKQKAAATPPPPPPPAPKPPAPMPVQPPAQKITPAMIALIVAIIVVILGGAAYAII